MTTKVYKYLLKNVIPYIRTSTYYAKFNGEQYELMRLLVEPGDIILTRDKRKLTGMLIPGTWDHAALVTSGYQAAQMTHKDFTIDWLFDIAKESDEIVVLRCNDFDCHYALEVVKKAKSFKDAKYDSEFTLGVEALYCSELIYQADFEKRLKLDLTDLIGLNRPYISPDGLYDCKNCTVVFDSRKLLT